MWGVVCAARAIKKLECAAADEYCIYDVRVKFSHHGVLYLSSGINIGAYVTASSIIFLLLRAERAPAAFS